MVKVIKKDVLVIGNGIAAIRSAIEASRRGADVLMIGKRQLRTSSSVGAGLWPAPPVSPYTVERAFMANCKADGWICDQELKKSIWYGLHEATRELEEMGVYWRRTDDGSIVYSCLLGKLGDFVTKDEVERKGFAKAIYKVHGKETVGIHPSYVFCGKWGETGVQLISVLMNEINRLGIDFLGYTPALNLLKNKGKIVGAAALDLKTAEVLAINAKSVIMALGSNNWLWKYSTGMRSQTGDSWAIPLRAGAELANLEFQDWHHADVGSSAGKNQWPKCWTRVQFYPYACALSQDYPKFYNLEGERFMQHIEIGTEYSARAAATAYQIKWGKGGTKDSANSLASLKHFDMETANEIYVQLEYIQKMGIDPKNEMLETGMSAHNNSGGVLVNAKMEAQQGDGATLAGLYVAGANAFGCYNLVGGYVTGKIAGKNASQYSQSFEMPELDWSQVEAEEKKVDRFMAKTREYGYRPIQAKNKIREIMTEYMHYIKNERNILAALKELGQLRRHTLPKLRLASDTRCMNIDLLEAFEVENMLNASELYAQMCLFRKETRGSFHREDYPEPDNEHWLCHTVARQMDGKLEIYSVPVEFPYFKPPPDVVVPFFDPSVAPNGRWITEAIWAGRA